MWLLWAALTCPLIFCIWFFLVPFLVNSNTMKPEGPTVSSTTSTTPEPCLKPVTIREPIQPLRPSPDTTLGPSNETVRPFFCLYRNDAVTVSRNYSTAGANYDFTFEAVPFELCHYVIYWSVAIDNGNITSRMPSFDRNYGLYRLRNITDRLGYLDVKILLALGGYPEDGPHFSMLGRDPVTLDRLTANVIDATRSFRLDGVTVNWVDPGPRCGSPDDQETVAALLRALRRAFDNNGMTQAMVTAMLDGGTSMVRLVSISKDAVSHFFFADYPGLTSVASEFQEVCATSTDRMIEHLKDYINSVPGLRWDQICAAEPAAFLAVDGDIDVATQKFMMQPERGFRWAPVYEACGKPNFCKMLGVSQSCFVHSANWGALSRTAKLHAATLYFYDVVYTLQTKYNMRSGPPIVGKPCVFVTLIEYDNYAEQCGVGYSRYILLQHLYFGALGIYRYNFTIENAAKIYDPANRGSC
ncbi:hypothetical protein MTO96_031920 [Rhipicephalus appendiculatus]